MTGYEDIAGTKRQQYDRLRTDLLNERSSHEPIWKDLDAYIWPGRSRFQPSDRNKGQRKDQKIINSTATYCADVLQAGMMSGNTNPSSDWVELGIADQDLSENGNVKNWLHTVSERLLALFHRSNLYTTLPTIYGDSGVFGTGCFSALKGPRNGLITTAYPIGSYLLAVNSMGRVDTFIRDYQMTVRQIVQDYVWNPETNGMNWKNCSTALKNAWDRGNKETLIDVCWVVTPNMSANPDKLGSKYHPFASCHFETGNDEGKFLRESGFRNFPILAHRWSVGAEEIYGTHYPGRTAIGHVRSLQLKEKRLNQLLEKFVNPPLGAPTHMINQKVSSLPGDVTYYDQTQQSKIEPIYQITDPKLEHMGASIKQSEEQIANAFYKPLFLMFEALDRGDVTATEILERKQEKLLTLGPVVERIKDDLLDPLIDIAFSILEENGEMPPPPQELEGMNLKVVYLGVFAQAQRAAGVGKLDRFIGSMIPIAQISPDAMVKVNFDQVIDGYQSLGLDPNCIRTDDDVAKIRQQIAEAQEQQRQAELAEQMSKAGKNLGQTPMGGDTALSRMTEGV